MHGRQEEVRISREEIERLTRELAAKPSLRVQSILNPPTEEWARVLESERTMARLEAENEELRVELAAERSEKRRLLDVLIEAAAKR